jgi:hypothetical protein
VKEKEKRVTIDAPPFVFDLRGCDFASAKRTRTFELLAL